MGWKRVKDHYQIGYLVHANDKGEVIIGSQHIPKSIIISRNGRLSVLFEPSKNSCLLYTSPSPRDKRQSRMPSSA